MSGSEKNIVSGVAMSGNIAIFVVPRTVNCTSSQNYISQTANKAGSLFDDSTLVGSRFLAELGGLASYCITYLQTFFRKMPRTEKVSKGAQGVSSATVNARNRVTSSVQTQSIYKVSIHALSKILHKLFAKSGKVCTFEVREHCNYSSNKVHTKRLIRRCPCLTSILHSCGVLAKQMGQRLFFVPIYQPLNF